MNTYKENVSPFIRELLRCKPLPHFHGVTMRTAMPHKTSFLVWVRNRGKTHSDEMPQLKTV